MPFLLRGKGARKNGKQYGGSSNLVYINRIFSVQVDIEFSYLFGNHLDLEP